MKKKTVSLLNSLKTVVETSYPNLPKKMQKQILEDFVYDSLINQLSYLSEAESIKIPGGPDVPIGTLSDNNKAGALGGGLGGFTGGFQGSALAVIVMSITGWTAKKALEFIKTYGKKGIDMLKSKMSKSEKNAVMKKLDTLQNAIKFTESCIRSRKRLAENDFPKDISDEGKATLGASGLGAWSGSFLGSATGASLAMIVVALTGWTLEKATAFIKKYGKKGIDMLRKKMSPTMKEKAARRIEDMKKAVALAENTLKVKKKKDPLNKLSESKSLAKVKAMKKAIALAKNYKEGSMDDENKIIKNLLGTRRDQWGMDNNLGHLQDIRRQSDEDFDSIPSMPMNDPVGSIVSSQLRRMNDGDFAEPDIDSPEHKKMMGKPTKKWKHGANGNLYF